MIVKLKNKIAFALVDSRKAKWLASLRTMRSEFGWQCTPQPLSKCKRILVIRPDEIGDVVMMSAFLRELRKSAPKGKITVCLKDACRPLLENCPYIDQVIALPFRVILEPIDRARLVFAVLKIKFARLGRGFDLVLCPRVDADRCEAELVAYLLAGLGRIWMNSAGFIQWSQKAPLSLGLADKVIVGSRPQSDVLANLEFLKACGGQVASDRLEFWASREDEEFASRWLDQHGGSQRCVVFHPPGGGSPLRRWAPGRSRELVREMLEKTGCRVVVVGGPEENWIREEMSTLRHPGLIMAVGVFTLRQLGAIIGRSGYFVGGDSGPMHLAAAAGARVIGIFGPGSEKRFAPWSPLAEVVSLRYPCSPDAKGTFEACCTQCIYPENRCLTEMPAQLVLEKLMQVLQAGDPKVTELSGVPRASS